MVNGTEKENERTRRQKVQLAARLYKSTTTQKKTINREAEQ